MDQFIRLKYLPLKQFAVPISEGMIIFHETLEKKTQINDNLELSHDLACNKNSEEKFCEEKKNDLKSVNFD